MKDFENLKSGDKLVLNTCNYNDNSSTGDYPESVVLEYSAKPSLSYLTGSPGLVWQIIQETLT